MKKSEVFPNGMKIGSEIYRDYELREQIVADEVVVLESEDAARAMKSDAYFNICVMARRLTIPRLGREITSAEMMNLTSVDFNHLLATDKAIQAERVSFRDAAQAAPDDTSGTSQAGI